MKKFVFVTLATLVSIPAFAEIRLRANDGLSVLDCKGTLQTVEVNSLEETVLARFENCTLTFSDRDYAAGLYLQGAIGKRLGGWKANYSNRKRGSFVESYWLE